MKRQLAVVLGVLLIGSSVQPVLSAGERYIDKGEVLVKCLGERIEFLWPSCIELEKEWSFENEDGQMYTLGYFTSKENTTQTLIEYFSHKSGVEYVEENLALYPTALDLPNDPFLGEQWYVSNEKLDYDRYSTVDIGIESIWIEADNTIEENIVAVIDTGVDYTHPDLIAHMWENTTTLQGQYGYNFIDQTDDPMDTEGHGTHCAGLIAAVSNNDRGISGISRNTQIMALKCIDRNGKGTVSQVVDAYSYILQAKAEGANIVAISNAWYGQSNPKALEDVINTAGEKGILSVCAAGNDGQNIDRMKQFPASYQSPYMIVVGASTPDDEMANFSNYGRYSVDVVAPGTNMLSTYFKPIYLPGVQLEDSILLDFEGEELGVTGEKVQIVEDRSFSGTHALLWTVGECASNESYVEGRETALYSNYIQIDIPISKADEYLGLSYWVEGVDPNKGEVTCYIDGYQNDTWKNIGKITLDETNYWKSVCYPLDEGITQLRLIGIGSGANIYLDQIGIGINTGKYAYLEGTSMATAVVSAEVAMLTRIFPEETPSQIRGRVVGGVQRHFQDLVVSNGRIDMLRAMEAPYPVMNEVKHEADGVFTLAGEFFGDTSGRIQVDGSGVDITSWQDDEIIFKYTGHADGYTPLKITRQDGESSEQILLFMNTNATWKIEAPLPITLKGATVVSAEDQIYVLGGKSEWDKPLGTLYVFNSKAQEWQELEGLPQGGEGNNIHEDMSAAILDQEMVVRCFNVATRSNDYYIYSIKENAWRTANIATGPVVTEADLVTYKEAIYLIGGYDKDKQALSTGIWKLNKAKTEWEKVADLAEGRYAPIIGVASNQLIITGGNTLEGTPITSTEIFNGKKLITGAAIPFEGFNSGNTVYGGGANLYVMTDGISFDVQGVVYEPDTNTWRNVTNRLGYTEAVEVASVVSENRLYAIGGEENYRLTSTVRSMEVEADNQYQGYSMAFWIGVLVIVIIVLVILVTIWVKKKKKPKKMYIR